MQIVAPKNTDFQEYANIPGEERERERERGGGEFHASRVRSLYYHSGAESHDTDSIASLVAVKRRCERWLPVARYAEPIFRT